MWALGGPQGAMGSGASPGDLELSPHLHGAPQRRRHCGRLSPYGFLPDSQKTPLGGPGAGLSWGPGRRARELVHVRLCPCPSGAVLSLLGPLPTGEEEGNKRSQS